MISNASPDNTIFALWLSLATGPATTTCRKLIDRFGNDPVAIYKETDYENVGLTPKAIAKLKNKDMSVATEIYKRCVVLGIRIVVYGDVTYPTSLANIPNFPYVIYTKGINVNLNSELCIGIVGTRDMTPYGKQLATGIAKDLAESGCVVVSGLAKGIDSAAHTACVESGGYTVAVLGAGIDKAKRWDNEALFDRIEKTGMLVSEYPPGTESSRITFPQRNRIISGLSKGVVVVEAGLKSGALITADCARKQGRRVYVMTGPTYRSTFEGAVELLKNGATLITSVENIIGEFEDNYPNLKNKELSKIVREHQAAVQKSTVFEQPKKQTATSEIPNETDGLEENEKRIFMLIGELVSPTSDELVYRSGLDISELNEILSLLEIYGKIRSIPGGRFEII